MSVQSSVERMRARATSERDAGNGGGIERQADDGGAVCILGVERVRPFPPLSRFVFMFLVLSWRLLHAARRRSHAAGIRLVHGRISCWSDSKPPSGGSAGDWGGSMCIVVGRVWRRRSATLSPTDASGRKKEEAGAGRCQLAQSRRWKRRRSPCLPPPRRASSAHAVAACLPRWWSLFLFPCLSISPLLQLRARRGESNGDGRRAAAARGRAEEASDPSSRCESSVQ